MNRNNKRSSAAGACLRWLWATALVCCATSMAVTAQAQTVPGSAKSAPTVQIPEQLTRSEVRDLVARLSDEQVRQLIISQLDKQAAAEAGPTDPKVYVGQLRAGFKAAVTTFRRMFSSEDRIYEVPSQVWQHLTDRGRISGWYLALHFIGLLLAGLACERVARRFFKGKTSASPDRSSLATRVNLVGFALVSGSLRIAAFAIGAGLFIEISTRHMPAADRLWSEFIWCLVLIGLIMLAVRELRALNTTQPDVPLKADDTAQKMMVWTFLLSGSLLLPQPLVETAIAAGADSETMLLLSLLFGSVFVALVIVLVIRLRTYGTALILGDGEPGSIRQALARSWWILAIVYLLIIWLAAIGRRAATGESSLLPGIGSLVLLALVPYLDRGLKALISWYFASKKAATMQQAANSVAESEANAVAEAIASRRAPAYIATALRYSRAIMVLLLLIIFVRLWDINLRAISAEFIGQRFSSALFDISITALLTWALWGIIRISIERKLDEDKLSSGGGEESESEAGGLGGTRVATVLPLIRVFIKITLIVMAVLISLSALGVNIGPLIAGAGVVGIAIGFGAQTLVRDIVSGFFYLLDDAFRIGEYVVIDNIRGAVEKISVRSFQLRHHNGPVHTIPYGEIRTLTNWSRDWAIMKFELRIPFETDIDQVRKIIKKIGIEMMEDPEFGPLMLGPLKSQGVNRMDDSALIIRCKFTAIPGQQYLIRREAFTRIQRAFDEKGIHFAPRRVLVEASTPGEAVKAAAAAIDQEKPEDDSKPPPM